ncbi:REG4 protein, partial [Odontophorus gujanensis]|nr:REG4 protein [Odontophorus gujanensis]
PGARYLVNCPEGWSYYKLSCFRYFRQHRTWEEAEEHCQNSYTGAHLAWVEEPKEAATLSLVISYYQRTQPVWLGLHYLRQVRGWGAHGAGGSGAVLLTLCPAQSRDWRWSHGVKYDDLRTVPGNGAQGGSCALLTRSSSFTVWSSADCDRQHHFICKFTP